MDIIAECTWYSLYLNKVKNKELFKVLQGYDRVLGVVSINGTNIEALEKQYGQGTLTDAVGIASAEVLEDRLEAVLEGFIGKFPYYLVYSENVEEDGISGYKLCKEITNTVTRSFDFPDSLVYIKDIKNGIECKEDGSTTYIIGLTADEYENINGADFDKVSNFVNKLV